MAVGTGVRVGCTSINGVFVGTAIVGAGVRIGVGVSTLSATTTEYVQLEG